MERLKLALVFNYLNGAKRLNGLNILNGPIPMLNGAKRFERFEHLKPNQFEAVLEHDLQSQITNTSILPTTITAFYPL